MNLPPGWRPSRFTITIPRGPRPEDAAQIHVEEALGVENGARVTRWAIRRGEACWTRDRDGFRHEPLPSSRDAAWLAESRWPTLEAALQEAALAGLIESAMAAIRDVETGRATVTRAEDPESRCFALFTTSAGWRFRVFLDGPNDEWDYVDSAVAPDGRRWVFNDAPHSDLANYRPDGAACNTWGVPR